MRNEWTFPPPHPLGRAPISAVYGIVGIPFVSLRGRNCRFRSHLGCSGLGSAFSLECLNAPMVLLTIYLDQDGSTGFLRIRHRVLLSVKKYLYLKMESLHTEGNAVILLIIFTKLQKVNKHTQNLSWALLQERKRKDQKDENNAIYNCNF